MEESLEAIRACFPVSKEKLRTYTPLALAYVGDAVYELVIRTMLVSKTSMRPGRYHQETIQYVNAAAQTALYKRIKTFLSEEEENIFRRGRNTKMISPAKNQSHHDYRMATGLEALVGYLYLDGRMDRIMELMSLGIQSQKENEDR